MSVHAGLWQRSDQAPVFNVIAMKDTEGEQVNDAHINNCLNQTISEFVFANVLLPMFSGLRPSHSILYPQRVWLRLTDIRLWTLVAYADCQIGAWDFFSGQISCSKQELSALLPDPLLSSAQRTHHSVLDALSAGLVVPLHVVHEVVCAFEWPLAW